MKPRSNSFSHPNDLQEQGIKDKPISSIILEEDEDIEEIGLENTQVSDTFIPGGPRISKTKSLGIHENISTSFDKNNETLNNFKPFVHRLSFQGAEYYKSNKDATKEDDICKSTRFFGKTYDQSYISHLTL